MSQRPFVFAARTIVAEAGAAELDWLEEFLAPAFAVGGLRQADQHVRLALDPARYAALTARGPHPSGQRVPCFTLDSGVVTAPAWNGGDDALVVFDESASALYRRAHAEPRVIEVIAAEASAGARVALMRVVRELGMRSAARGGWLLLHAAAVALDRKAVVVAGAKRAGKTTLLMYALAHGTKAAFIANDRTALGREGRAIVATGIPTIVSLRPFPDAWFPGLAARLLDARYHHRFSIAESRTAPARAEPALSGWSLGPQQFCRALGVEPTAVAPLTALVFPSVDPAVEGVVVEEVSPAHAVALLERAAFRRCPASGLFEVDGSVPERDVALSAHDVVAHVRSFRCRLGAGAYRDGVSWLERLRAG